MGQLDYALIGNCQVSALLSKEGSYSWSCMPALDSPSVFASILSEDGGFWDCLPTSEYTTQQRYLRNTNIVLTEFFLKNGDRFEIRDFSPRFAYHDGYYHAPQFIRIIKPIHGNPQVKMRLRPRFCYGSVEPDVSLTGDGLVYRFEKERLYLNTDISNTYVVEEQPFELSQTHYCVLSHGHRFSASLKFGCEEYFDRTHLYWRNWVKHCAIPSEFQEAVIRSALALKLHIFEDTGAIIAATTTSIPESTLGGRTWDYRYCWLRDAYFVIQVLNKLGQFEEMERFIRYLHNIAAEEKGSHLQPVYGINGRKELDEKILPWLPGFKGIGPVRVGNAAYTHHQYDAYGEMVLAVTPTFFDTRLDHLDSQRSFEIVLRLVDKAIAVFDMPDSGIWEFRGEMRHYLFSKIMCWAAVDRGLKIAAKLNRLDQFTHWQEAATRMHTTILENGFNRELGIFTQAYGIPHADASNLLMANLKFLDGFDEKFVKTVAVCEKELNQNGYVFRYRNSDDFGVPKNAFTICTFWMVDALVSTGRKEEARTLFERVLKCANHVGLLSEDVDPLTGELWGNFPQAYSHVGIINCAFSLSKSWTDSF